MFQTDDSLLLSPPAGHSEWSKLFTHPTPHFGFHYCAIVTNNLPSEPTNGRLVKSVWLQNLECGLASSNLAFPEGFRQLAILGLSRSRLEAKLEGTWRGLTRYPSRCCFCPLFLEVGKRGIFRVSPDGETQRKKGKKMIPL